MKVSGLEVVRLTGAQASSLAYVAESGVAAFIFQRLYLQAQFSRSALIATGTVALQSVHSFLLTDYLKLET